MTVEDITLLAGSYLTGAVVISLVTAFWLDQRLAGRLPGSRTYMWGFFFGCICIAYVPLAALSALETVRAGLYSRRAACEVHGVYTLIFALNVVCGWFIIRRKAWAWVIGTLLGPVCAFPVLRDLFGSMVVYIGFVGYVIWPVNYLYGRSRWGELHVGASVPEAAGREPCGPAAAEDAPLLLEAIEPGGQRGGLGELEVCTVRLKGPGDLRPAGGTGSQVGRGVQRPGGLRRAGAVVEPEAAPGGIRPVGQPGRSPLD